MDTLEPEQTHYEATCNLAGGPTVTFNAPWPEQSDTPEEHPVRFWLDLMPTADETDPD